MATSVAPESTTIERLRAFAGRVQHASQRLPLPKSTRRAIQGLSLTLSLSNGTALRFLAHQKDLQRLTGQLGAYQNVVLLVAAHRVGLFERIPDGGAAAPELARLLRLNDVAIVPFLDALTALGYLRRTGQKYSPTPFARHFLRAGVENSAAPAIELLSAAWTSFGELADTLRTGKSPKGMSIFDAKNPSATAYIHVINSQLKLAHRELMRTLDVRSVRRFIVGSAGVTFAKAVLDRNKEARVVFACLPHLVAEIPTLMKEHGIPRSRVESFHDHAGDPYRDKWDDTGDGYDLVFLTRKLSLKPVDRFGKRFLEKAHESLRPGARVVVWEPRLGEDRLTPRGAAVQAAMDLFFNEGGRTHTEGEIRRQMQNAGFSGIYRIDTMMGRVSYWVGVRG
ncbi:MAG: hypothetical protein HYY13_08575 [Nitrospirae bacterium]|nr:hypothetical protein [Nitrospirota bacterium]